MGQPSSKPAVHAPSRCPTLRRRRRPTRSASDMALPSDPDSPRASSGSAPVAVDPDLSTAAAGVVVVEGGSSGSGGRDYTSDLPDDCLALVFHALSPGDRKRCSLVCRRWLLVEARSRHRLSLDARASLSDAAKALFTRFDAVSKLALKCDRRADSINDDALGLISLYCPLLTRLKLRACRQVTDEGMATVAANCRNLRKLSCGSCAFGAKGVSAVLVSCSLLEELSIKRLRGLTTDAANIVDPGPVKPSVRSVCLKELYNGQSLAPLITSCKGLKTLKLIRCFGEWDKVLQEVASSVPGLVEVHLEKLQVSDKGLSSLTACPSLEILHLVKTPECTDIGFMSVADNCRLLRKIHIDGWKTNRIGDNGLSAVARRCPNLQELVLIGVNPTALSLALIAENCKNLERLALCSSETFGDAEMSCIASKCAALRKLCIKGCPVSDQGIATLAVGCPNLVKVKLKKCRGVTAEGADWLRVSRGTLSVNLDTEAQELVEQPDASASESGMQENGNDQPVNLGGRLSASDVPSTSSGRSAFFKARQLTRNFMSSTFKKLSRSSSSKDPNP